MNVYCGKDGNLMVQNIDHYTCLKCECIIIVELVNDIDVTKDMGCPSGYE